MSRGRNGLKTDLSNENKGREKENQQVKSRYMFIEDPWLTSNTEVRPESKTSNIAPVTSIQFLFSGRMDDSIVVQ